MPAFLKLALISIFAFSFSACVTGHCRKNREASAATAATAATPEEVKVDDKKAPANPGRIKVYKNDGTLQCGMGKLIPLDTMKKELGKITVYSSENKSDGLMHIQMCGSPTGTINIYEIDKTNLDKAIKLGFKEWTDKK